MSNIIGSLDGISLQPFTIPFNEEPIENAADVTALDGTMHTDWINKKRQWTLNWATLSETDYDSLYAVYEGQFTGNDYPHFVVDYYNIDVPVRVYINEKDVRNDGCDIRDVRITLMEQYATGFAPGHLLLDGGNSLLLDDSNFLLL